MTIFVKCLERMPDTKEMLLKAFVKLRILKTVEVIESSKSLNCTIVDSHYLC